MKDRNLLKQKLALIASNAVLSDSVINALDDAVALLGEDAEEIDKLRRHNASLVANGIQASLSKDEIVTNTLKNARLKIEKLFRFFWTWGAGLALLSLVLAWCGL